MLTRIQFLERKDFYILWLDMVKEMIRNGMDCVRLNFSHGTHEEHLKRIDRLKRIRQELKVNIPILLDTKGPEIRLQKFENGYVMIEEGKSGGGVAAPIFREIMEIIQ